MEEKETTAEDSIERHSEAFLWRKNGDNFSPTPIEISASPEEGVRLIRAFIRIKQPELRAAIIKLTTQMADVGALTMPVQN